MSSAPRSRKTSSVGAAMETGVLNTVSSRFIAVTVTSSETRTSRTSSKSSLPPASRTLDWTAERKPESSAVTE